MHEYPVERRLSSILYEAQLLRDNHSGIHNMHGALSAIYTTVENNPEAVTPDGVAYCEAMLAKMKQAARTGVYPKRDDPVSVAARKAADKFFGERK